MAKPNYVFKWCEEQFDSDGELSRIQPPPEVELTGTLKRQAIFRLWYNEGFYNLSQWTQWLSEEAQPVGTVVTVSTGTFADASEASTHYGGTWVSAGTDTIGTESVDVYKKTVL